MFLWRVLIPLLVVAIPCGCATQIGANGSDSAEPGAAIAVQRKSLAPTDGGRLARPADLLPGDILLSAAPGLTSTGIRLLTFSPVSHAAVYVGDGEVAEAVGHGVQLRRIETVLAEESVVVAFRHPVLDDDGAQRVSRFARDAVGKQYNYLGVLMHAPFALERRACELPGLTSFLREACLSALAALQIPGGGDNRFFCSEFVLESYRAAGLPITRAQPAWVSPADLLHMRAGDVPSLPVEQPLLYVGHLKFAAADWELPGLPLPLPALWPDSGSTRP